MYQEDQVHIRHDLLGESAAMKQLVRLIAKAARTNSTVLIRGESGTGKELIARAIHQNSARSRGPFVPVNCAALTETLVESELFGHERGAFTGALAQKKGEFELASGGTLFLDEVGELSPPTQAKLLRAVQEREVKRVGGARAIPVDIRVIAATNRDLVGGSGASFREDLYYRLNVLDIKTTPLRERPEDIPILARTFATRFAKEMSRTVRNISPDAEPKLLQYPWPGNVRELQNVIERAVALGSADVILPEDLPEEIQFRRELCVAKYHEAVNNFKRSLLRQAIARAGGNRKEAARLLGLSSIRNVAKNVGV